MRPPPLALFVAALSVFLLTAPPFWQTLAGNVGLAALVAMGLVLLTGVGGMTSFGQAAFMGFGAYTTAILTTRYGLSPWATLPLSLAVTGVAALVLGGLTVRLAGHYLPLGTLAWGLALYYLFGKIDLLGRHDGIVGIPPLSLGSLSLTDPAATGAVTWTAVLLAAVATTNLLDSRVGRAIRALRGGDMAQSFGVHRPRTKLLVFVYAAMLAGLAGWLYAHVQRTVNPTPFGALASMEYLFMAVVGGAGRVWGAVVGAAAVLILKDALQRVTPALFGRDLQLEAVVFGVVVVGMLQVARDGIWPRLAALWPSPPPPPVRPADLAPVRRPAPNATGPLLEVEGAVKRFGGLTAVNKVDFSLGRGEILALIGPNGAGKSTTFNLITGVLPLSAGAVRFAGRPIDRATPAEIAALGIARTFQHVKLVPEMSVIENVALGAHLRGRAGPIASLFRLDREEETRLLGEAARQLVRVGLAGEAWKPAGSLALGQQRIVEIARALALDPNLLLLDEPAAGLRHFEKVALADLLARLRAEGMSILLVEHDMGFVMGLVDRIVVLDFGTRIAEGRPEAVRRDPAVIEAYLGGAA
ncbi:branched-chain amino acid ABC transporter ATP-binding protein/permease [Prosthecomicrobium sp. N25]|uniref:branched-chain amino acid ABC transporter ATP-binding protein/permease n=1 Tax=Prosthecomicrobium sp. N25 TaxID=3129254 RepID=UPI0030777590